MAALYSKEIKIMRKDNEFLCPNCERGKESYILDSRSPFCPYIKCHTGSECAMFKKIKTENNKL